jgi:hypothetical protein
VALFPDALEGGRGHVGPLEAVIGAPVQDEDDLLDFLDDGLKEGLVPLLEKAGLLLPSRQVLGSQVVQHESPHA